jgi:ABC-type ATPase with predicted acetyltransferase domain
MKIAVRNSCEEFKSYRAARVKSLFNAESGANFDLDCDLPIDDADWKLGVIVGPSGSGKTSIGRQLFGGGKLYAPKWSDNKPIIDEISPNGDFNATTAALAAVGLGSVPAWLRPYSALSNGEKFRADLARAVTDAPREIVIDEFSSVVDRQIAKFGALAFGKAWKRTSGKCVLLSCHYDIVEWLEPDWVFDIAQRKFTKESLRRPKFALEIRQTGWEWWSYFEPHHYLKLPKMIAATNYVGFVDGEPVAHLAVSTRQGMREARACRLVVAPEWQGAGVGMRFLNFVCEEWRQGRNRYNLKLPTLFHTSHPGLCASLRRDPKWTQVSATLYGANKGDCARRVIAAAIRKGGAVIKSGYGGHFRAVQGFRYLGGELCG